MGWAKPHTLRYHGPDQKREDAARIRQREEMRLRRVRRKERRQSCPVCPVGFDSFARSGYDGREEGARPPRKTRPTPSPASRTSRHHPEAERTTIMLQGLVTSASQLLNDFRRSLLSPSAPTIAHPVARRVFPSWSPATHLADRRRRPDPVRRVRQAPHRRARRRRDRLDAAWLARGRRGHRSRHAAGRRAERCRCGPHSLQQPGPGRRQPNCSPGRSSALTILGVVHTHPGSLRHPSEGDLKGDRIWVQHLRGKEGVFAIGTADAPPDGGMFASRPKPNVHCLGKLRFSWYALQGRAKVGLSPPCRWR